jgi:hypothetical protein
MGYGPAHGTSLATPLVGGLAALIKEAQPTWTGHDIRVALMGTGTQSGAPDNAYGYGIARGLAAIGHGGATPSPPRTSLPFALLEPEDGDIVSTTVPVYVWSASEGAVPQDTVIYRVYGSPDSAFTTPVLLYEGPDTTTMHGAPIYPGTTVWWRVEATGVQGYTRHSMNVHSFTVSSALEVRPDETASLPVSLGAAHPNPMTHRAAIGFRLPTGEAGTIDLVSVSGRLVRRFTVRGTGEESAVMWDGRDNDGRRTPAGVYYYRLGWRDGAVTRKLVRLP